MSRNAISANPEHYLFKIFREDAPGPPRRPKKNFLATAWLQKFFGIDFPLKQKILDRTLVSVRDGKYAKTSDSENFQKPLITDILSNIFFF